MVPTMAYQTIMAAIKAYIDQHPNTPANYFQKKPRVAVGWFNKKIYLVKQHNGWELKALNSWQLAWRRMLLILTFGQYDCYGNISLRSFHRDVKRTVVAHCTQTIQKLFQGLITLAEQFAQTKLEKVTKTHDQRDMVRAESFKVHESTMLSIIDDEPHEKNAHTRLTLQHNLITLGHRHYKVLFHAIDKMTHQQRTSLVRLLSSDVTLSLGIWTGVMHYGKSFQQSTREQVRTWIPGLIQALSIDQFTAACLDAKFWEVVELFPTEVSCALSLAQWQALVDTRIDSALVLKIMLKLPVDESLYGKLLYAAQGIAFDAKDELGIKMLINQLKLRDRTCSIHELEAAFKKSMTGESNQLRMRK